MDTFSPSFLLLCLLGLIIISGFFSSSETGMMAVNRYKLRHLARKKHRRAHYVVKLLERPDRLLGVILIGNTLANNLASIVAILLAKHYFGGLGVAITVVSLCLTLILLIFAEVGPKTIAAMFPQKIAFFSVYPLVFLLRLLYPFVWFANGVTNGLLRLCGIRFNHQSEEQLNRDELRTLLAEVKGVIPVEHQDMLLSILELEEGVVEDIMVPRNEVVGIDLKAPWEEIWQQLTSSQYAYLPLYKDNIDQVVGMLHVRKILPGLLKSKVNKESLLALAAAVYFIPENTSLTQQLIEFRDKKARIGLVVDEYGELQGLVALEDILEQIVGEFTTNISSLSQDVRAMKDGSYLVDGTVNIRELNRLLGWHLPTSGPRTLNGLIVEHLETLPQPGIGFMLSGYPVEVLEVEDNLVKLAKVRPCHVD